MAKSRLTTPAIPFPSHRARKADPSGPLYDRAGYTNAFIASCVVQQFEADPDSAVRSMLSEKAGADALANALEGTKRSISFLRAVVANLVVVDQAMSAAADRVLSEAGI